MSFGSGAYGPAALISTALFSTNQPSLRVLKWPLPLRVRTGLVRLRAESLHERAVRGGVLAAGFEKLAGLVEVTALLRSRAELERQRRGTLRGIHFVGICAFAHAALGAVIEEQRIFFLALAVGGLSVFVSALHVAQERARAVGERGADGEQRADEQRGCGDLVVHGR